MCPLNDDPAVHPRPEDTLTRYERFKARALQRMGLQRACSELIWDIGDDMTGATESSEWKKDVVRKDGKEPTKEDWAHTIFKITLRQARKYYGVRAGLRREEVAGIGLCLDRLYQVKQATGPLRDLLIELGKEGLSHLALSAGRRAALPLLAENKVAEALREAERAARKRDRKEEEEETGGKEKDESGDGDSSGNGPDMKWACRTIHRVLEEILAMADVDLTEDDERYLREMKGLSGEMAEQIDKLLSPEVPQPPPPRKETSAPAQDPPRKETSAPAQASTSFRSLIDALPGLSPKHTDLLEINLHRVAVGHPVAQVAFRLRELHGEMVNAGAPLQLADRWLELMMAEDGERRRYFALWFHRHARLRGFRGYLDLLLAAEDLPPGLRQKAEAMRDARPAGGTLAGTPHATS